MALLEAIDHDLDERGLVDKGGKPRYLLNHRSRIARQLDHWLGKISEAIERQAAAEEESPAPERADYVRELERIALGRDPIASTRDRVAALKELLKVDAAKAVQLKNQTVTLLVRRDEEGNETIEYVEVDEGEEGEGERGEQGEGDTSD
jgi:hypothetical protein